MMTPLRSLTHASRAAAPYQRYGRVAAVRGNLVEIAGLARLASIGSRLAIHSADGRIVQVEATGLAADSALCLPFDSVDGIGIGARADLLAPAASIRPSNSWLGRVIDGLGRPVDGMGPLVPGMVERLVRASPPAAHGRARVGEKIATGVNALDIFAPLCRGQRLGLFAGSGVGKSVLFSMLAKNTDCDVAVIGLIGERGREVQEFLEELGEEARRRIVMVVATSDEPALARRQAAYMTLAVAEHFRDEGLHVLCMMDSVTRFAMAQREIGLASGEPPATKGYTPTVFAELPRLLERAGPGNILTGGAISGLFTVLVDGGDHDEPVADAVRGILDGHIVMERAIAERGRYPAINVLKSVSRTLPAAHSDRENQLLRGARAALSTYADMEEMIRLGAYRHGSNPDVDRAILLAPAIERLIEQKKHDRGEPALCFDALEQILGATE